MKIFGSILLAMLLMCQSVWADDISDVENIIKPAVYNVVFVLKQKEMDKPDKNQKIRDIINPLFDFQIMAKYSLGSKYWKAISTEDQDVYSNLFIERMKESYIEKMYMYTDEEVEFEEAEVLKKRINIMTHFVSSDNNIDLLYKFYESKTEGWKVYDVEIEGVSIIQTYRSQFDSIMKKGTIKDLIEKLKVAENFSTAVKD